VRHTGLKLDATSKVPEIRGKCLEAIPLETMLNTGKTKSKKKIRVTPSKDTGSITKHIITPVSSSLFMYFELY
jgi:hypothetical protein